MQRYNFFAVPPKTKRHKNCLKRHNFQIKFVSLHTLGIMYIYKMYTLKDER